MANMSSSYEEDLFKKIKLKQHRVIQHTYESEIQNQHNDFPTCNELFKPTIQNKQKYCFTKDMVVSDRTLTNEKLNSLFNLNIFFDENSFDYIDILFNNLRPLLNHEIYLTKELIKKVSCLLINTFINWYRTLPFYSIMNIDLNKFILNNQWSNYIVFVIFYFLKTNFNQQDLISYKKCYERIFIYTQDSFLSSLSNRILNQYLYFLSTSFNIDITNTEFILLSILLILQSGKMKNKDYFVEFIFVLDQLNNINLNPLHEIYSKTLYTYEINNFPSEQPFRYNQLLYLSQQIHLITQTLITHQHFYLPFLLIPN